MTGEELLRGVTMPEIMQMATENPKLRGYLQGYVAEFYLKKLLEATPGITNVAKIPDSSAKDGDFSFDYNGRAVTLEAKSLRPTGSKTELLEGGVSGVAQLRGSAIINAGRTSSVSRTAYDILAICTFPTTGKWDFYFIHSRYLPTSTKHTDRMTTSFRVNLNSTPCLYDNITRVLADLN